MRILPGLNPPGENSPASSSEKNSLVTKSKPERRAIRKMAGAGLACAAMLLLPGSLLAAEAAASTSGTSGIKASVVPGNDFFAYANGTWIDQTTIPEDRSSWGAGAILGEETNKRVIKLLEQVLNSNETSSRDERKAADFYAAYMDEAAIEAKALTPLQSGFDRINAISDKQKLARVLGSTLRADVDPLNATNFHTENLFGLWVAQGLTEPERYKPYLLQGGLGMPDRDYYLSSNPKTVELRGKYQAHIAAVLKLAGLADAEQRAAKIFDLELQIAKTHASQEESQDVVKANNNWSRSDFSDKAPGMDWAEFFAGAGLERQRSYIVWHPSAVKGAAALVESTALPVWKDYLSYHLLNHFSPVLPKAFADQNFAFYGTAMTGTPQQTARSRRALDAGNAAMRDAIGRMYVEKYFPASAKARIQTMVTNIIGAFDRRIEQLDWMAPATKAQAREKLKTLYVGVGYPEKWRSYTRLQVYPDDALGNIARSESFAYQFARAKLGHAVDKKEWCMPVQIVNAVNMPLQNALNFPAGILQPPFFDPEASDAVNYGAIGAVIGHEISHSFDDTGSQFDAQGRLRDWWTPTDLAHFKTSSAALVAQYSAYKPFSDLAVNGQQTLSENIADLAGLAAAYDAYHAAVPAQAAQQQQAADQQFFLGFAQSWRNKMREPALRRQIITNGHAPSQYRASTVRNIDAWYSAFDVKPGQDLYLDPKARVRVW
ncbi:M13 family metallopeptidase [Undibacterium terreum]|uniref:Peptidase M13 n=1 Tax=Undibacterium terreum TaxID=1224302 RepID=A0A916XCM7_9BURK|nr:M13 family metallopeptidase [Undibacterium terreum]GGC60805.1 peptidase M13 [Undibacterium terreum]